MKKFLENLGVFLSQAELDELFTMFDSSGNGQIDFAEFLSLVTKTFENNTEEKNDEQLRDAFNLFDDDQDNLINVKELHATLQRLGVERITKKDVVKMIDEIAPELNGYIDFPTFKKIVEEYI